MSSIDSMGKTSSEILKATPFVALEPKERWAKLNLLILTSLRKQETQGKN